MIIGVKYLKLGIHASESRNSLGEKLSDITIPVVLHDDSLPGIKQSAQSLSWYMSEGIVIANNGVLNSDYNQILSEIMLPENMVQILAPNYESYSGPNSFLSNIKYSLPDIGDRYLQYSIGDNVWFSFSNVGYSTSLFQTGPYYAYRDGIVITSGNNFNHFARNSFGVIGGNNTVGYFTYLAIPRYNDETATGLLSFILQSDYGNLGGNGTLLRLTEGNFGGSDVYYYLQSEIRNIILENLTDPTPPDPFAPGGTSEPGGGGGTFDDDSDEIPDSSLPTLSAANTGFTRIYNPTLSQVQAMANYLWTDDTVIETIWNHIKQFLEDPMDAFIAFNLVPCVVPNGGTSNFKVMYIDTGVTMTTAANQFVDVDCGTVQLDRYYGSALDYTPYTRVGCFLPYIGTVELDTDEVMGATLQVKYRIDIVSGACVAKIFVDGTCLYQYSGHCAINIPFTSADFSNYVNAIIQVAKAGLIAASGVPITSAGAGEAAEQLTGRTVTTTKTTQRNPATGRQIVTGTETTERDIYSTEASFKGLSPSNLANTVGAVMGSKPMIEHSGGFNGNSGYLGIRRPFLIIKRPRMCNPSGYGALNGYPCMIRETLGNLSGYTQVQQVQLTGLSATNPEQAEILQLLKQGVIL